MKIRRVRADPLCLSRCYRLLTNHIKYTPSTHTLMLLLLHIVTQTYIRCVMVVGLDPVHNS